MNQLSIFTVKALRRLYKIVFHTHQPLDCEKDFDVISDKIVEKLSNDKPCMICRFGSTELSVIHNYLGVINPNHSLWRFIQYKEPAWWWNNGIIETAMNCSGIFPATAEIDSRFAQQMLEDMKQVDILGSWCRDESFVIDRMPQADLVRLIGLEPFFSKNPWTRVLEGKRVVVVHPFLHEIEHQYKIREKLFKDDRVLPSFNLRVVKAVQSLGGEDKKFANWFEAFDWMKTEIDKEDYDVAILGCGAYGFPLAAHCKRMGKKAIHMGGATQLLFGIKGNRWEKQDYGVVEHGVPQGFYLNLMNEYWIRPSEASRPHNAQQVEGACYW